jgi:hypothetical protein
MAKSQVEITDNPKLRKMLVDMFDEEISIKLGFVGKPEMGGRTGADPKESFDKDGNIVTDSSVDVAYIGLLHEFGNEDTNLPQRSFLRSTYEENKDRIAKNLAITVKSQMERNAYNPEVAINKVAVWMVGKVKKKFRSNDWEPLKNPSRRRVGQLAGGKQGPPMAPTPLVDTGQLVASIDYEIVRGGSK